MKFEEKFQHFKSNYAKLRNETNFFSFAKQLETLVFVFFQFRETIGTRRNSTLFRTVSYFAKLKKYETVYPNPDSMHTEKLKNKNFRSTKIF